MLVMVMPVLVFWLVLVVTMVWLLDIVMMMMMMLLLGLLMHIAGVSLAARALALAPRRNTLLGVHRRHPHRSRRASTCPRRRCLLGVVNE